MPRIVDGDNLLGNWPGRKRSDADRRRLIHDTERLRRRERRRIVLVFDGPAPPAGAPGADVRYSGPGRSADDVILDWLREHRDRRGWAVVTEDRSLADQCRWLGARIEKCAVFRGRLLDAGEGDKPERVDDVAYWLEVFGDDPDT
jgi:hypothetical protein